VGWYRFIFSLHAESMSCCAGTVIQVLALKELSIRGDIRTTTEYLVDLLESSEYASNTFNTRYAHSATDRLGCEAVHSLYMVVVLSKFFPLIHRSHSISFTRAQGIPKYKIGFGREKDGRVGERLVEGGGGRILYSDARACLKRSFFVVPRLLPQLVG
jgi:hypothetical protein